MQNINKAVKMAPNILKTDRLVLKVLEPTGENVRLLSDTIQANKNHLSLNLPLLPPKTDTVEKTSEYLEKQYKKYQDSFDMPYYIFHNGKLCGFIGTKSFEYSTKTELTYWLTQDSQGKGFMAEALKQIEHEHFKRSSNSLVGLVLKNAERSAKLLNKGGYELKKVAYVKTKEMYDTQTKQTAQVAYNGKIPPVFFKSGGR